MKTVYLCARCGAACRHLLWEAMDLPQAEERCPACRQWSKFRGFETGANLEDLLERSLAAARRGKAA